MTVVPSISSVPAVATAAPLPMGRGLSPAFLAELERLLHAPEGQWWRDVLLHPDVIIAVRREAINVYHRGAAIFLAEWVNGRISPRTHIRYLARQRQAHAMLDTEAGTFALDVDAALWHRYEGAETLADMLRAAASLAGPEKLGLHALLLNSPHVVDVEIVLQGAVGGSAAEASAEASGPVADDERAEIVEAIETADAGDEAAIMEDSGSAKTNPVPLPIPGSASATTVPVLRTDRLDVATLEERDGAIYLVFHEAKHFANKELRAAPNRTPPVLEQIGRYRATIGQHTARLADEYADVCCSLAAIHGMRAAARADAGKSAPKSLHPLIMRVANGEPVHIDPDPRLVIFGFDEDQRSGTVWGRHRKRLVEALGERRLYAVGNTRTKTGAAFG